MITPQGKKLINEIAESDGRYRADAYYFVLEALDFTITQCSSPRHVRARELADGIRVLAESQFGVRARAILEGWGLCRTRDFGHVVFNLIENGLLSRLDNESVDDFDGLYEFDAAFPP